MKITTAVAAPADLGGARASRLPDALLLGVVLGSIALALAGVVHDPAAGPPGAVAVVNGRAIAREELDAVLERLATQLGHEPGAAERAEVLSRLIDEELLIQRGLALDLPRADARLRNQLVQQVMSHALQGTATAPVSTAELAAFHAANKDYFRHALLLRAARFDFESSAQARDFSAALAGSDPGAVLALHARERSSLVPGALLTAAKLGDHVGADTAARLASLQPGESLLQETAAGGATVLVLLETQAAQAGTFESQRAQVEAEFRRRRDEAIVAEYLQELRADARIVTGG